MKKSYGNLKRGETQVMGIILFPSLFYSPLAALTKYEANEE